MISHCTMYHERPFHTLLFQTLTMSSMSAKLVLFGLHSFILAVRTGKPQTGAVTMTSLLSAQWWFNTTTAVPENDYKVKWPASFS